MRHRCPRCSFGRLRPARSTYVRRIGWRVITVPNFALWRCDVCGYSRYDSAALARVDLLLGPEIDGLDEPGEVFPAASDGPAARGPRRWPG
jgi:YgiT-type zinc finger domain-containing protein